MDADGGYERFISGVSGLRGCIFMHQAKIVDVITKMMAGIPKEGPEDFFDAWPLRRLRINGSEPFGLFLFAGDLIKPPSARKAALYARTTYFGEPDRLCRIAIIAHDLGHVDIDPVEMGHRIRQGRLHEGMQVHNVEAGRSRLFVHTAQLERYSVGEAAEDHPRPRVLFLDYRAHRSQERGLRGHGLLGFPR